MSYTGPANKDEARAMLIGAAETLILEARSLAHKLNLKIKSHPGGEQIEGLRRVTALLALYDRVRDRADMPMYVERYTAWSRRVTLRCPDATVGDLVTEEVVRAWCNGVNEFDAAAMIADRHAKREARNAVADRFPADDGFVERGAL